MFRPVIAVIPYDGDDEAVAIANDSEYGLSGSVWTADEERGFHLARRVRTGTIEVNYYTPDFGAPFSGMKASGIGELDPETLDAVREGAAGSIGVIGPVGGITCRGTRLPACPR